MKNPDAQTDIPFSPLTFRGVAVSVFLLLAAWTAVSVYHHHVTRNQIRTLFHEEAREMASALAMGERAMARTMNRLRGELADRLLTAGHWLRDIDSRSPLTRADLLAVAEASRIFNAVVFAADGSREFGLRGGGPPWGGAGRRGPGGGRGGGFHAQEVLDFLESGDRHRVEGLHSSGGSGDTRFSVMVRRAGGGAIMINIDAQEQEQLLGRYGPGALLAAYAEKPNVRYVLRVRDGEIVERHGEYAGGTNGDVFEASAPLPESGGESLIAGFDNRPIAENEHILLQRLALSTGTMALLGVLVLLWTRLRKRYFKQSDLLRKVRSYHRAVLDTMDEAVIAWDGFRNVTFWNPKAERLFPELAANPAGTLPDRIREIHETIAANGGETVFGLAEAGGAPRRYRAEEARISGPHPTQLLLLGDVTAVEEATREHGRREHLEALAKVASGVAHEVRNPLNAIAMSIQTLCAEPSTLEPDDRETLESLRGEIERINAIVQHFLAYGRPRPPEFSEVDPAAVARDSAAILQPHLEDREIRLAVKPSADLRIRADAQQLRQALINIILNAAEASPPGASIELTTEKRGNAAVVTCRDRGCGMTHDQLERIFDPYVTHKPGGTGLGMSIVKRIVECHGGAIHIDSEPEAGTTVELRFPLRNGGED